MSKTKARRRSRVEREAILAEFRESGVTQGEFCLERGIGLSTFQYWVRKAREAAQSSETQRQAAFVEVKIAKGSTALALPRVKGERAEYDVVLRSGQRLVVRSGFEPEEVAALVDLLEAR